MAKYADITIHEIATTKPAQIPGDITDFIGVFDLSEFSADWWNATSGDGVCAFKGDTDTEIARELVDFTDNADGTGSGQVWFKGDGTTASGAATYYYVGRRPGESDYAVDATYGAENVWKGVEGSVNDYGGVWHLNESSGTRYDSTANGNDLTDINTVGYSAGASPWSGNAASFVRANSERLTIAEADQTNLDPLTEWTFQAWAYADTTPQSVNDNMAVLSKWNGTRKYLLFANKLVAGGWRFLYPDKSFSGFSIDTWLSLSVTNKSTGNALFYIDGGQEASAGGVTLNSGITSDFNIGSNDNPGNFWDGLIAEARLCPAQLSDDFIETEYNNQNDVAGFWTLTDEAVTTGESVFGRRSFQSQLFNQCIFNQSIFGGRVWRTPLQ